MDTNVFSFGNVPYEGIQNEFNSLDTSSSTESEDIQFKINADIFTNFILKNFD